MHEAPTTRGRLGHQNLTPAHVLFILAYIIMLQDKRFQQNCRQYNTVSTQSTYIENYSVVQNRQLNFMAVELTAFPREPRSSN